MFRAKAPLRVSFTGGGTDIPSYFLKNGGKVISTTIDRYVHVIVSINTQNKINIYAYDLGEKDTFPLINKESLENSEITQKYPIIARVISHFPIETGFDLHIYSDLPAGSGMGTSSSLTVALIAVFSLIKGEKRTKKQIAELACKIERHELNQAGGYQDQYAASFGGVNHITFGPGEDIFVERLNIIKDLKLELEESILLCYTGKTHISSDIQKQVLENFGKIDFENGMIKLKELVEKIRSIFVSDNLSSDFILHFGTLMHEAWKAKKMLSNKISTNNVDYLYNYARNNGALGGKLLGAGGGGYILLVVLPEKRNVLIEKLKKIGLLPTIIHLENDGVQAWRT